MGAVGLLSYLRGERSVLLRQASQVLVIKAVLYAKDKKVGGFT